jgi:hypothetical protein
VSAHDPRTVYAGANKVLKSTDRGGSWTAISPDLSNPAQGSWGAVPHGTITTLCESRLDRALLWAGTEGGDVHVTRDGGRSWTPVHDGLPRKWVSRVVASSHVAGRAYVALTGYREDDFAAYLFASEDHGARWTSIRGDLPDESINVVREDPTDARILYVGTDLGVHVSIDRGTSWMSLSATLPTTPVHDLVVHPRESEIVIGTHGRSAWVLDVSAVREHARK